ncbi:synaptotagmin-like protein 3 [Sceloporus undulatus]|uniref:synaptotagmin-like protein 3 n=1 Tax=Sceloporus undulatus TaxID=8520 RepID=UPI001C4D7C12|nr:synaptotagmin-like protein 3 [Sceloporus undulatus]XP_042301671.1 synaptotagmin-like protein 3 [Sceloporus undulatus]XP_042301672.1 synaptotagmin-like protein 3 [Sceloporus undulatus]XP_042301673.1 synaptotagmin-like protein 3 [Sceloporus undulatus]XP_042301674.1 synaptotagmin-like protein 3 [Sceloporus undulatus]
MSRELDLNFLKGLEQEIILEVLHRDQILRKVDEERIRNLKIQLQKLRWKRAKSTSSENQAKSCARCQRSLGMLINRGAVCNGCSHQVCSGCRIYLKPSLWMCTICYAYEDVKVKTGEWFFEKRAKKFPTEGRRETAGAKLLKSYQLLSNISVVPPTPPPFAESTTGVNTVEHDQSKSFHRSMENLFLSFTTHIRKMSKSQNDMTAEKGFLTANYVQEMDPLKERRTMSDTAIDMASKLKESPSLQHLISGEQDNNETAFKNTSSEEFILSSSTSETVFSAGIRSGSLYSVSSTCTEAGNFDIADVSGEIEFAIKYVFRTGTLEVCIGACKNLAYGEEKKKCNPYVKTCLLPDKSPQSKRKTSVKKDTVDPLFQETLKYKTEYSQLETRQLQVSVWHSGTFRRRVFLGEVVISFESWDFEDNSTQSFSWYQLKAKPEKSGDNVAQYSGELLVRAKLVLPSLCKRYQYEEQLKENTEGWRTEKAHPDYQLHVIILGASNLPMIRSDGLLNSFVKGCLSIQGKKDTRQRTPVQKKKAHPQWNHLFVFSGVTTSELHQSSLDLTVWDQVTFGLRDQFLGGARLGKYIPTGNVGSTSQASLQWEKMLNSPNTWTDITLMLYPNAPAFKV